MDLQGCVNDATDWAGVLAERGFKVASLLDEQATKAAMLKAMGELIAKASKGRHAGHHLFGHGTYQPDTDGDGSTASTRRSAPTTCKTNGEARPTTKSATCS